MNSISRSFLSALFAIVCSTLRNYNLLTLNLIYNAIHFVDPPTPPALIVALQWLWLAKPLKGIALDVFDEGIDPPQRFLVLGLPVKVIFPTFREEQQIKHHPPPSSPAPPWTF